MTPPGTFRIEPVRIPFSVPTPNGPLSRFVFAYLLATSDRIVLIDTGVRGSEELIFNRIRESGRKPEEISLVILTHAHPDHIGAAKAIRQATGCTIAAHAADRAWIQDPSQQARERPVPGFSDLVGGGVAVDRVLGDGDSIDIGDNRTAEVIHTPGHSPGSICLFLHPDRDLFTGDAVPVPGDLPVYDDPIASMQSINRLRKLEHIHRILPAWNDPAEGKAAYQALDDSLEYLHHIHDTVKEISGDRPVTDPLELTRETLKAAGLPADMPNPMVIRSVMAHLRAITPR
jgi:glyoxylase-like metal-dependent hydrolase (beta-lactamase superfamily II)